jgi:hypothetical protein
MKEQTNKLYRITTRLIDTNRKGEFKEESPRWQQFNVVARNASAAMAKCEFEPDEKLDEIELLNENVIL